MGTTVINSCPVVDEGEPSQQFACPEGKPQGKLRDTLIANKSEEC